MNINKVNVKLTSISNSEPISDVPCGSCNLCCNILAPYLTPEEVSSGKYPISLVQPTEEMLTIDPTIGPIVSMFKSKHGGCSMLVDDKCSIYEDRPIACRQYDCRKGHHPKTNQIALDKFGVKISSETR